jgi:LAO/AO transport system kinase
MSSAEVDRVVEPLERRMEGTDAEVLHLVEGIRAKRPAAVARAITWVENGDRRAQALLASLPERAAHVVGVTGSPGAGKSTLVNLLVRSYRADGRAVGVIAVDPSSPLTGGALLGDRIRLEDVTGDRGVFFRSLASRGASGGLSEATLASARILSAADFDTVIIETVGAGQAEVAIMRVADSVVLVLVPGAGDEVQAHKAGLMEIADVYVLNKADLDGADGLQAQVHGSLLGREDGAWVPRIVRTVATRGTGGAELVDAIDAHAAHLTGGSGEVRRRQRGRDELVRAAMARCSRVIEDVVDEVVAEVDAGALVNPAAERALVERVARRLLAHDPARG